MIMETTPRLPTELNRIIFELAFDPDDPPNNAKLTLVSRHVCAWLKPLIYRVFIQMEARTLYPNFRRILDIAHFGPCRFAKHMLMDHYNIRHRMIHLLQRCPNIEDLFCWADVQIPLVWDTVHAMAGLRRLYGNMSHTTLDQLREAAFAPNLTHLLVIGFGPAGEFKIDSAMLHIFPNLTHFAMIIVGRRGHADRQALERDVQSCRQLQVFIYYAPQVDFSDKILVPMYAAEKRMVVFSHFLFTPDAWISGTRGGQDTWSWAGSVVYARQHGYFKSDEYQEKPITEGFYLRDHLTEEGIKWYDMNIPQFCVGVQRKYQ